MSGTERTYRINEIFRSLQGEGYFTGTPSVFIRMSGCNRNCSFCDTDHSAATEMTAGEIIDRISGFNLRHVVVTGGEPLLQLDRTLTAALKDAGYFIAVETNGSMPVPEGVDWVTCSPKERPWHIDRIDELKIVYRQQDVESIRTSLPEARHHFLQPCSGANIPQTVEYIINNPHWRA